MQQYVFSLTRILANHRFCPYAGEYGSVKPIFWNALCRVVYCHTEISRWKSSWYQIIHVSFFSCKYLQRRLLSYNSSRNACRVYHYTKKLLQNHYHGFTKSYGEQWLSNADFRECIIPAKFIFTLNLVLQ